MVSFPQRDFSLENELKILIIAINFPPLNKIGSRRILSFANGLSRAGHDVTVVTSVKREFDGRLDYVATINDRVRIIEVSWGKIVRHTGPEKSRLGEVDSKLLSGLRRVNRWLRWNVLGALFHPYDLWAISAARDSRVLEEAGRAEVVLSSFGPAAPHYLAAYLKRRFPHLKWVADFRDLWSTIPTERLIWPFKGLQSFVEKSVVKNADGLTGVSNGVVRQLLSLHGSMPSEVVFNGYSNDEVVRGQSESKPLYRVVRHIGTIYPGLRDPSPLFKALNQGARGSWRAEFVGPGSLDLASMVAAAGCTECVRLHPPVSAEKAKELMNSSDCLLLLESEAGEDDGTLTAKIFEYMHTRKPIIAIGVKAKSELGSIVTSYGRGYVCGNSAEDVALALARCESAEDQVDEAFLLSFDRQVQCDRMEKFLRRMYGGIE